MFIARQPIFNRKLDVFGYELLFRGSIKSNKFDGTSSQSATAAVIGGLFESGIDEIVDDKYAFINFDEHFIYSDSIELISPDRLIIEMLEDVKVDQNLVKRLEEIKRKGYKIALDDFVEDYEEYPLVALARIIKFDLIETPLGMIEAQINKAKIDGKIILAEKVENEKQYLQAKEIGFHLFQGYFFSKPNIVNNTCNETSSKSQYTRLLWELKKTEPSYQALAEIIEQDVNLAYRFLRVISSRSNKNNIYSIKKGLTYMGLDELERWVSILMFQDLGKEKPKELIRLSLIRTRFAQEIALQAGLAKLRHEASMLGLFSTLDAVLDRTMEEALEDIALTDTIKEALVKHKGKLYPIYRLILAYEKGDWVEVEEIAASKNINTDILGDEYLKSIKWANEISGLIV